LTPRDDLQYLGHSGPRDGGKNKGKGEHKGKDKGKGKHRHHRV
jgi:hypothetical protein